MKFLKEEIILLENMILEFRTKFSFEHFKKLNRLENRIYAKGHLPFLGQGSSRAVFALPNMNYVLKIATNDKGLAQNEAEVSVYTNPKSRPIVAKIRDAAPNYAWIVSEITRPMNSWKELCDTTGVDEKTFSNVLGALEGTEHLEKDSLKHPFIKSLYDTAKANELLAGDLNDYEHYGKTADGRVVVLDYGFTEDVFYKHYN